MKATTINEVLAELDKIIEEAKKENSPSGYFAALYRKVTYSVKEGIERGDFQNKQRMMDLDVTFANRYLEAYHQYKNGEEPTTSWKIAFENTERYWPIVLQQLLWGMNAHINLDLGIAAAEVAPGHLIDDLKTDFDKINDLLASLVGEVEQELTEIWPTLKYILAFSGKIDTFLINFSMEKARDGAWKFATDLATKSTEEQALMIKERDAKVANIAQFIYPIGIIGKLIFKLIRIGERGTVRHKISILEQKKYKVV